MATTSSEHSLRLDVIEMFAEQRQFRGLLWQMTKRDLLLRYKQTVMGFAWAVFMPLINTAIFATVFARIGQFDVGVPYPLYAFSGILAWSFFASTLRFASTSLSSNAALVSKVYCPREIFPVSQVLVCLVDNIVAALVLVGMLAWFHIVPDIQVVWLPLVLVAHVAWTTAAALLLAMGNLFFRDVKYLLDAVLSVAMFSTTALYPGQIFGTKAAALIAMNPLSVIFDAYRAALFGHAFTVPPAFPLVLLGGLAALAVSWLIFHRAEHRFAENV